MLRTLTVKPCNRIIKPAETSISLYRSLCFPAANKNLLLLKRNYLVHLSSNLIQCEYSFFHHPVHIRQLQQQWHTFCSRRDCPALRAASEPQSLAGLHTYLDLLPSLWMLHRVSTLERHHYQLRKSETFLVVGQLFSKAISGILNSSKKRAKNGKKIS